MTTSRYGENTYGSFLYGAAVSSRLFTWTLNIDWDNDGVFDGYNEINNLQSISMRRGRQFIFNSSNNGFDHVQVGEIEITLKDIEGRYDPYDEDSPLAGNLYKNQKLRLLITDEGTGNTYPVFFGYIDNIISEYGEYRKAKIYAKDGLQKLRETRIRSDGIAQAQRYDAQIQDALTLAGWTDGTNIDTNISEAIPYHWFRGNLAINEINDLTDAAFGTFFVDAEGNACYKSRLSNDTPVIDITDADIDYYYGVQTPAPRDVVKNVITIYSRARTQISNAEVWRLADKPLLSSGTNSPIWANYNYEGETSPALFTYPLVANVDYTANANLDGSGTDRTSLLSFTVSNFATASKITPRITTGAYLTLLRVRGDVLKADKYTFAQNENDDSVQTYGRRELEIQTDWLQDINAANELAQILLLKFQYPKIFPRLKFKRDAITKMFAIDLFELADLNLTQRNVTGEYRLSYIEMEWTKQETNALDFTVYFEPNLSISASDSWTFPTTFPTTFPA